MAFFAGAFFAGAFFAAFLAGISIVVVIFAITPTITIKGDATTTPPLTTNPFTDTMASPHKKSSLEKKFCAAWKHIEGPELEEELRFHPERRWRADFAHMGSMTLIEVEGGIHVNGRHNRATGFIKDAEKYLEATLLGWRVIRLVDTQLNIETLTRIANALREWEDPDQFDADAEADMLDLL